MSQALDIFEGNYLSRKSVIDNSHRNPLKLFGRKFAFRGYPKASAFKKHKISSSFCSKSLSRVNCKLVECAELLSLPVQAGACNGEEHDALPNVYTLREFPREELFRKVVMVRFDSKILLGDLQEQQFLSGIALSTIKYLCKAGARVVLVSSWDEKHSKVTAAESVAEFLSSMLELKVVPVKFVAGIVLLDMEARKQSDVLLLDNLFHFKEESANCKQFAKQLSSGIDIFVNDAFSQSHKILASTVGIAGLCCACIAGFYFEEGLRQLKKISTTSQKPYFAIKILWIGPVKFGSSSEIAVGASKLAAVLDNLKQGNSDIIVVGKMACQEALPQKTSHSTGYVIENASVVWEFLKGRNLPGLMALDRAYPFETHWDLIYDDPTQSLVVDIGSGNGLFLFGMARMRKDLNFLGLEINEKLVKRCLDHVSQSGLKNGYFISTNATSTFRAIVSSYPGKLVLVSIQIQRMKCVPHRLDMRKNS